MSILTIYWAEKDPVALIRKANATSKGRMRADGTVPGEAWYKETVLAAHSTAEWASLIIEAELRRDVASQIVRATCYHPRHVMQSGRPDWTGKSRSTDPEEVREYIGKWSIKALQELANQRLCGQAFAPTREAVQAIKRYLATENFATESETLLARAVAWSMVPYCVHEAGCRYGKKTCGWWAKNQHLFGSCPTLFARFSLFEEFVDDGNTP